MKSEIAHLCKQKMESWLRAFRFCSQWRLTNAWTRIDTLISMKLVIIRPSGAHFRKYILIAHVWSSEKYGEVFWTCAEYAGFLCVLMRGWKCNALRWMDAQFQPQLKNLTAVCVGGQNRGLNQKLLSQSQRLEESGKYASQAFIQLTL